MAGASVSAPEPAALAEGTVITADVVFNTPRGKFLKSDVTEIRSLRGTRCIELRCLHRMWPSRCHNGRRTFQGKRR